VYFSSSEDYSSKGPGRKNFLANATAKALTFLSREGKPFFLMVEGALIDSGGHLNSSETVIEEGIGFDMAIAEALKFADKNKETLVIVTADHETGGVTLPQGNMEKGQVELEFGTRDHTAVLVPIFAYGPHSDEFRGIYENTEVFKRLISLIEKYRK
jgi:alkaline phosphatase